MDFDLKPEPNGSFAILTNYKDVNHHSFGVAGEELQGGRPMEGTRSDSGTPAPDK